MVGIILTAAWFSIRASEKSECRQWQGYAKAYEGTFTMPAWAKMQCDHYGIDVGINPERVDWDKLTK